MGSFTVAITADVRISDVDAEGSGISGIEGMFTDSIYTQPADLNIQSAEVYEAKVSIDASVTFTVEVEDMTDFDATQATEEAFGYEVEVINVEFEVESRPEGFDIIAGITDEDTAHAIFVALAVEGLSIS